MDGGRAGPGRALRRLQRPDLAARTRTAAREVELATESRDSEGRPVFVGGGTHPSSEASLATGLGAAELTGLTLVGWTAASSTAVSVGAVRGVQFEI